MTSLGAAAQTDHKTTQAGWNLLTDAVVSWAVMGPDKARWGERVEAIYPISI